MARKGFALTSSPAQARAVRSRRGWLSRTGESCAAHRLPGLESVASAGERPALASFGVRHAILSHKAEDPKNFLMDWQAIAGSKTVLPNLQRNLYESQ